MNLTLLRKMHTGSYTLPSDDGLLHCLFVGLDSSSTDSSLFRLIDSKSLFIVKRLLHFGGMRCLVFDCR